MAKQHNHHVNKIQQLVHYFNIEKAQNNTYLGMPLVRPLALVSLKTVKK